MTLKMLSPWWAWGAGGGLGAGKKAKTLAKTVSAHEKGPENRAFSMGDKGLEPYTNSRNTTAKTQKRLEGGAPDGARQTGTARNGQELSPDLAEVVNAWPMLPAALQAGIVAMVKAAGHSK